MKQEQAMSDSLALKADARPKAGKGASRAARRAGQVPCVIYGAKQAPDAIQVSENDVRKLIKTGHFTTAIIEIDVAGKKQKALMRDIQLHPVSERPVHIDFLRVDASTKVFVRVPVHFKDQADSPGIKRGGVLNIVHHDIELECPAGSIPDEVMISLAGLDVGATIHLADVILPAGIKPHVREKDFTVATIIAPSSLVSSDAAAEPVAAVEAAKPAAKK
jgi:large subunit ribosomal protein L25